MFRGKRFSKYLRWILVLTPVVIGIIVISSMFIYFSISFKSFVKSRRNFYIEQQKHILKREVNSVIDMIKYDSENLDKTFKDKIKKRVEEAYIISQKIYEFNKDKSDFKEIQKKIVNILRDIKFFNGAGYYCIIRIDGIMMLCSLFPDMEQKNVLNIENIEGKKVFKDIIDIAKKSGEGFYEFKWKYPGLKGNNYTKIVYFKLLKPLGLIIITEYYKKDEEICLKKSLLNKISNIRFGKDGYIFVLDTRGKMLSHINENLVGKNMWDVTDPKGVKIVQEFAKLVKNPEGGFLKYIWPKPSLNNKPMSKITYVKEYRPFHWIIGAGVYVDDVENQVSFIKRHLQHVFYKNIVLSVVIFLIILSIFSLFFRHLIHTILQDIKMLGTFFKRAVSEDLFVDKNKLNFAEFRGLASQVNHMLKAKKEIYRNLIREKEISQINEAKYKSLIDDVMDSSNVGLFILDKDFKIVWVNKALERLFGLKREEIIGKDKKRLVIEKTANFFEDPEDFKKRILATYEDNTYVENFICHMLPGENREERWLEHWSCPIKSGLYAGGRVEHYVDITDKIMTLRALEESENKLKSLFSALTDRVFEIDDKGRYLYVAPTPSGMSLLRKKGNKIAGKSIGEDLPPDVTKRGIEAIHTALREKRIVSMDYPLKVRGEIRWFESRIFPKSEHTVLVISRNITDKKNMEIALREREENLRITLNSIAEGVIVTDIKGNILRINPSARKFLGIDKEEEVINTPLDELLTLVDLESKKRLQSPVLTVLKAKKKIFYEENVSLQPKNGMSFPVDLTASPLRDSQDDDNIKGVVIVFNDITDKLLREQEKFTMEKLRSIGILAGGIAHDFNNMLTGIFGNIEIAKLSIPEDSKARKKLEESLKILDKAKSLTSQLLTFAKGGDPVMEEVDLKEMIEETVRFYLTGSNIQPVFDISPELWMVRGDKNQIGQVIQNLILNAKEAMPGGGNIFVEAKNIEDKAHGFYGHIKISIRDEGVGIPEKYVDKIFDPYFSTKQMGSGLGLTIVYSIIKKHNGHIRVHSISGEGTRFEIFIPAIMKSSKKQEETRENIESIDVEGRVLILEDEDMIAELYKTVLEEMSLKVTIASTGEEAISLYREAMERGEKYNLVIMDLTIPGGMGGKETIKELLKIDREVKAIVASGYSTDPVMTNYREYGFIGRLPKPFKLDELKNEVLRILKAHT